MSVRQWHWLVLLVFGLFVLCGAGCPQSLWQYGNTEPRLLPPSPTLEQVIEVVNRNNSRIESFFTNRAAISGPGMPSLRASIAFQRPKRFRFRAETGLTGAELDIGSNDEVFWFWARRNQPPAIYYCRHEQYESCPSKPAAPLEPRWLIEALGVAELDPALPHQGPAPLPNDRLQIRTIIDSPEGPLTKITIIDGSRGWILEQQLYDARRRLLAASLSSRHRRDPLSGLVMPTLVEVYCPPAQLMMRIELGNVEINRLRDESGALWTMPNYPGATLVDIADPNFQPSGSAATTTQPHAADSAWRPARP